MIFNPHSYQKYAIKHILDNPYSALFLDMGLGKTVSALTAINELMFDRFEVSKTLVVAPLRVADTVWPDEVKKWDHLKHLRVSKILGGKKSRIEAIRAKADIYVINLENVAWLISYLGGGFPFDMLVLDELSSFKDHSTLRFKALRQVRPLAKRVVGLTGTPAPNGLINLWLQLYLLDRGQRLGRTITEYRNNYFVPGKRNGQVIFEYKPRQEGGAAIYDKISDICVSMKASDYLELPERIDNFINIRFDDNVRQSYEEFERTQVLRLAGSEEITAASAAALCNKLLQFANGAVYGAVYGADRSYTVLHDYKLDELGDILEFCEGKPVLVFYSYRHDLERIQKAFKKCGPRELKKQSDIEDWNTGRIRLLLAHPKSAGHGLNLQAGGNIIVWFGLTWSLELYQQANARLHRQGQEQAVVIHHLVAEGTMDDDVIAALRGKADGQEALMRAVKARVEKYS